MLFLKNQGCFRSPEATFFYKMDSISCDTILICIGFEVDGITYDTPCDCSRVQVICF